MPKSDAAITRGEYRDPASPPLRQCREDRERVEVALMIREERDALAGRTRPVVPQAVLRAHGEDHEPPRERAQHIECDVGDARVLAELLAERLVDVGEGNVLEPETHRINPGKA